MDRTGFEQYRIRQEWGIQSFSSHYETLLQTFSRFPLIETRYEKHEQHENLPEEIQLRPIHPQVERHTRTTFTPLAPPEIARVVFRNMEYQRKLRIIIMILIAVGTAMIRLVF